MFRGVESFLIRVIGAFFFWAIKGFKGKFDDEMTGINDSSGKDFRNVIVGFVLILITVFLFFN